MDRLQQRLLAASLAQINRMSAEELLSWLDTNSVLYPRPGRSIQIVRERAIQRLDTLTRPQ